MEGLQGLFKGAMLAYFIICGIAVLAAAAPYSIIFAVLFLCGIVLFPILWVKYISKLPSS